MAYRASRPNGGVSLMTKPESSTVGGAKGRRRLSLLGDKGIQGSRLPPGLPGASEAMRDLRISFSVINLGMVNGGWRALENDSRGSAYGGPALPSRISKQAASASPALRVAAPFQKHQE